MILFTCSIPFVSQAELVGTFGGIFSFHSLSQVGLLLVDKQMVSTIWTGKNHFGDLYPKIGFCQNSYTQIIISEIHLALDSPVHPCIHPPTHPPVYTSIHLSPHSPIYLLTHPLPMHLPTYLLSHPFSLPFASVSIHLPPHLLTQQNTYLSFHPSINLLIHPSSTLPFIHPLIHPSVYLLIHLPFYPPTHHHPPSLSHSAMHSAILQQEYKIRCMCHWWHPRPLRASCHPFF